MRTAIIGDVHGRYDKLIKCMERAGLVDAPDPESVTRIAGNHIIQAGDLANLGYGSKETEFLRKVEGLFDERLIGNHELPALHFDPFRVSFGGWQERDPEAADMIAKDWTDGKLKVATNVGDWLVTHAGLAPALQGGYDTRNVKGLADHLNQEFVACMKHKKKYEVYDGIGWERGGVSDTGSIFWQDFNNLIGATWKQPENERLRQIVGHTPSAGPKDYPAERIMCIDTPYQKRDWGGVCIIVTEDEGKTWEWFIEL